MTNILKYVLQPILFDKNFSFFISMPQIEQEVIEALETPSFYQWKEMMLESITYRIATIEIVPLLKTTIEKVRMRMKNAYDKSISFF